MSIFTRKTPAAASVSECQGIHRKYTDRAIHLYSGAKTRFSPNIVSFYFEYMNAIVDVVNGRMPMCKWRVLAYVIIFLLHHIYTNIELKKIQLDN